MTEGFVTPDIEAWELALKAYTAAKAAFDALTPTRNDAEANAVHQHYLDAEDAMLALHAPHIDAVIEKLLAIWVEKLENIDTNTYPLMTVIGDLRRLSWVHRP